MQVHDTPLLINGKGATQAVTVGAGGADIYYGSSAATASRVNGGTLAVAGSTFQVTAPTWVVRSDQSQAPAADVSLVDQTPSAQSAESAASVIGTTITHVKASGTDDTTAISNALASGDVLLTGDGGDYNIATKISLNLTGPTRRRILAIGAVKIVQKDANGVFSLRGGYDDFGVISSVATVTNADLVYPGESNPVSSRTTVSQLTMSSNLTLTRGDIVRVVSDDAHPWARPSQGNLMGEYSSVGADVASGVTVNLSNVLIEAYATNIRLARLQDVRYRIEGPITFDTDPTIRDTAVFGAVVELRGGRDSYIGGGVRFNNTLGRAIGNYGYATHIDGVIFRQLANRPSKSQFGYGVQDGGWQLRMTNCHGERLRHLYSEGAQTVSAGSTNYEYFGGGSFAHVSGCEAFACEAQAFDTHGSSYGVKFTNCTAYGSFQGASSGGAGFNSRGRYTTFENCVADGCFRGVTLGGYRARAVNCSVRRARYSALEFAADTADSSQQTTQGGFEVAGGVYETIGASRTFSHNPGAGYLVTGKLKGVKLRPVAALAGHQIMEMGVSAANANTAGQKVVFEDVDIDLTDTGAVALVAVGLNSDNMIVRGRRLNIDHVGSAVTAATLINGSGAAAGFGADCQIEDMVWDSTNVGPTPINSSLTATLASYRYRNNTGSSWFHWNPSYEQTLASAASATLPIAKLLDRDINVRITGGSAASVTFSAIPATPRQNGARLSVINKSTDTISLSGVSIAPNAVARWIYTGGSWLAA